MILANANSRKAYMMPNYFFRLRHAVVAASVVVFGCGGDPTAEVSGTVKYNGAPLAKDGGQIVFVGPNRAQVVAPIDQSGNYRATNVLLGVNQVAVFYANPNAKAGRRMPEKGKPLAPVASVSPFLTPTKYAGIDTSELKCDVKGQAVFNVDLKGPAIP